MTSATQPARCPPRHGAAKLLPLAGWLLFSAWLSPSACLGDLSFERTAGAFCDSDDACLEGLYCDREARTCRLLDTLGQPCDTVNQCKSGFCVDGVCCNGPCDAVCLTCAAPNEEGTCQQQTETLDPRNDCPGTTACGANGFCQGAPKWSRHLGLAGRDEAAALAIDDNGDVVVVGTFEGAIVLVGDQAELATGGPTDRDVFVAKLDGDSGALLWATTFGTLGDDRVAGVGVDETCNIVIAGDAEGALSLFGQSYPPGNGRNGYVFQVAGSGCTPSDAVGWIDFIGGDGDTHVRAMAIDDAGFVALVGDVDGEIDFGINGPVVAGNVSAWVMSLASGGNPAWGRVLGDASYEQRGVAVATDVDGNLVVAIDGSGTIDFSLGGVSPLMASTVDVDLIVAKLARGDGDEMWKFLYGGLGDQRGAAVAVDAMNNVWFTGSFRGQMDVPGFAGTPLTALDQSDGFWVKLDESAVNDGAAALGGPFSDEPRALTVDGNGNAVIAGGFELSMLIDAALPLESRGDRDAFLLKIQPDTTPAWGQPFGGVLFDEATAVVTAPYAGDEGGDVFVAGHFEGSITLAGVHEANGGSDVFVSKLAR
jgi:hypothetical protein